MGRFGSVEGAYRDGTTRPLATVVTLRMVATVTGYAAVHKLGRPTLNGHRIGLFGYGFRRGEMANCKTQSEVLN